MRYTHQVLRPGEEILAVGKFHWLYSVMAYLWLILLGAFLFGIIIFLIMMIRKWTTEIVVTTDRLIYKTGWIARHTEEIALVRMEEVSLDQTILGRLMRYGTLKISGTGISKIYLPSMLPGPVNFRRALAEGHEEAKQPVNVRRGGTQAEDLPAVRAGSSLDCQRPWRPQARRG